MANIFKSKEVYKHVTTEPYNGGQHKLIPVRGVYVANVYRPPYCIDHTLEITNIESTVAEIEEYKETPITVYATDFFPKTNVVITNLLPSIVYYSKTPLSIYINLGVDAEVSITKQPISIVDYLSTNVTVPMADLKSSAGINVETCIADLLLVSKESETDYMLEVIGIDSNDAIIT